MVAKMHGGVELLQAATQADGQNRPAREADVMRQLPEARFTSVVGSSHARSSSDRGRSVNAAGLASNVLCPWHGRSCRANQPQRDATSLRIRDARPPCCVSLSWGFSFYWPTNVG